MKRHVVVFLCFIMLFVTISPALHAAKMSKAQIVKYYQKVCAKAKTDAEQEVSGFLWMGAGCLLNWIGVAGAYFLEAAPPADKLIGKPAYYTKQYTKCYAQAAKDIQTGNAWTGFAISVGVGVVAVVLMFTVFATTASTIASY